MPHRTCISREEKSLPLFNVPKERLSLLLGRIAAGDFKIKPLLFYRSEHLRALKKPVTEVAAEWKREVYTSIVFYVKLEGLGNDLVV